MVSAAVDALRPSAEAKGLTLELPVPQSPVVIVGDSGRLEQVVWNLLSNAVKFIPQDGRVDIRVERVDSKVDVRVIDTGQRIAGELLPRVFDRFAQGDAARARADCGLALV